MREVQTGMIQSHGLVQLKEYGGYYYSPLSDGRIQVQLPGTHTFFTTMPTYEVFTRFVDQANRIYGEHIPELTLHLTGCKRCARSLSTAFPDFFNPCKTGSIIIAQGCSIAQEISRIVAEDFLKWHDEQQHRLSSDDPNAPQTSA